MVGVGGSSPLGRTKNSFKNATLRVAFLFKPQKFFCCTASAIKLGKLFAQTILQNRYRAL